MNTESTNHLRLISPILLVGSFILMVSFSIRASFGVFQIPIEQEFDWLRSEFSLAIAIQNLFWGLGQPIFGAFAEKWGDKRAILWGGILYAIGLLLSSIAVTPIAHQLLEMIVGFGIAGTGFGVILAVVGRTSSPKNRSMALGMVTAAGSAGQVIGPAMTSMLLSYMDWSSVFIVFALVIMGSLLLLPIMGKLNLALPPQEQKIGLAKTLKCALGDPSYTMIFFGFFSCGFQLAFITAHFPAMVSEASTPLDPQSWFYGIFGGSTATLGAVAISLIGMTNIVGTLIAGALGQYYRKKYLLAFIYLGRTIASIAFILLPITPTSVIIFSLWMGFLWLATVPLTSGLVAQIYGLRYMGTLYGVVFFSHQLGAFLGVWLGGTFHDLYGSYTLVWWIGIGAGFFSAIIHLPIREFPLALKTASS